MINAHVYGSWCMLHVHVRLCISYSEMHLLNCTINNYKNFDKCDEEKRPGSGHPDNLWPIPGKIRRYQAKKCSLHTFK